MKEGGFVGDVEGDDVEVTQMQSAAARFKGGGSILPMTAIVIGNMMLERERVTKTIRNWSPGRIGSVDSVIPHFNILKALHACAFKDSRACGDGQVSWGRRGGTTGFSLPDRVVYAG